MKNIRKPSTLLLFALTLYLPGALLAGQTDDWVRFAPDGHSIIVEADGITTFKSVSSVLFGNDQQTHISVTSASRLSGNITETTCTTPFGDAVLTSATFAMENSPFEYTLKLKRLKNLQAFTLQGIFHNRSSKDVHLREFRLLDTRKESGGAFSVSNSDEWLVTPLLETTKAVPLTSAEKRLNEAAMLYHSNGNGFLAGPVGPAEAFTSVQWIRKSIIAAANMEGVLVRAGESRRSEEMVFAFEPIDTATDIWTRWVAVTHKARLDKGPVYGWCSWYDLTTKIDEAHVMSVTKTIEDNPNVFGKGIIQIDDGYQKMDGDWSANAKFPSGMASVAQRIRDAGCIPGIWFAPLMINPEHPWLKANPDAIQRNAKGIASFMNSNPFHPAGANWINPDHPESKKFLFNIIRDARDRGYGYIKIDFNGIGHSFLDPAKTRLQVFRELYAMYREAAGDDMYILSCLGNPTRGVVGYVDAARIGPDSHPAHFERCLKSVLRFQIFNKVWWQNDPDVTYIGHKLESRHLGSSPEGEGIWKTWHSVTALAGGTAMISDPINKEDARPLWRNYEIMRPGSREAARLLTLGKTPDNEIFGFAADRPYGSFAVYNLYNTRPETNSISFDFMSAGLPPGTTCAVFDFWENKVIGYSRDSYTSDPIAQHSSRLLRFTPIVDTKQGLPVLVGSDLHLSIGATEIENLRVTANTFDIDLNNAGAQEGSLTFFSRNPLKAAGSSNCSIVSVDSMGDNLWKVSISGRQLDKPQSLSLRVESSDSGESSG